MATTNIAYFEFKSGGSDKFYLMEQDPNGTSFTARYGRCGTTGSVATYPASAKMSILMDELLRYIALRQHAKLRQSKAVLYLPESLAAGLNILPIFPKMENAG